MDAFKVLEIKKNVYESNDRQAEALRGSLKRDGVFMLNLMSSPGSGKTSLLEQTLERLKNDGVKTAVIVGDQ